MTYHPRSEWNHLSPYPVTGPAADWSKITCASIHYTAAADCPDGDDPARVARFLANIQTAYAKPKAEGGRGYSIGYLYAVDQAGGVWQLRGPNPYDPGDVGFKSAANAGHNEYTMPILMLVDGAAPASPAAVAAVRDLISLAEVRTGRKFTIKGHGQLYTETGVGTPTACPGVGLQAQVTAGVFTPVVEPEPNPVAPVEDDAMIAIYRPAWFAAEPNEPWFCVSGGSVRPAVTADLDWASKNGVPTVDITDRVQYANLKRAAGL